MMMDFREKQIVEIFYKTADKKLSEMLHVT